MNFFMAKKVTFYHGYFYEKWYVPTDFILWKKVTYYHKFYFVVKNDMLPQILFYEKKYLFCYKIKFYG